MHTIKKYIKYFQHLKAPFMLNAMYHIVGSVTHSTALCSTNGSDHVTQGQAIKTPGGVVGPHSHGWGLDIVCSLLTSAMVTPRRRPP